VEDCLLRVCKARNERILCRNHLKREATEAPHISSLPVERRRGFIAYHLRSGPQGGTRTYCRRHARSVLGAGLTVEIPRRPKVGQFQGHAVSVAALMAVESIRDDEDIGTLDVAVGDAAVVQEGQAK